jgi:hypothetical protein
MIQPESSDDRIVLLQYLREVTAKRIEQEMADQQRMGNSLEEKHRALVSRLLAIRQRQMRP